MKKTALTLVLGMGIAATYAQDRETEGTAPVTSAAPVSSGTSVDGLVGGGNRLRASSQGSERDPMAVSEKIRARVDAPGAAPEARAASLPRLALRGIVESRRRGTLALLDVEGQVLVVRAGDTLTVSIGGRGVSVRIAALEQGAARVEVLGQMVTVR